MKPRQSFAALGPAILPPLSRANAQSSALAGLLTAPERTDFAETTRYVDVGGARDADHPTLVTPSLLPRWKSAVFSSYPELPYHPGARKPGA